LLNIIFAAGMRAIREQAEERAYASAAAERIASGEAGEIIVVPGVAVHHGRTRTSWPAAVTGMLRGRIYRAHLTHIGADKFFLVVSNNQRNRAFRQVLAARLTTTTPREPRAAMVSLGDREVMTGWVSCDDIETVYDDEVRADLGALTAAAMRRVEAGLRAAMGMPD
jgi:mRNA interferase MazF